MKKLDYFKLAVKHEKYKTKKWMVSVFALTQSAKTAAELDYLDVILTPTGYSFKNDQGALEAIEDAATKAPIYAFLDPIFVDKSWVLNAPEKPIETTYGNVIFNLCVMIHSFADKVDFVTGQVNIGQLEDLIAKRLTSDFEPLKNPTDIYAHEYVTFTDSLQFIANLASLCVVSATEKSIQIAPGLEAFKKELIKKYGDKLKDPTEYVKFEKELKAFDDEYLKGDASTRGFLKGRVKDIARKKMYLTLGNEPSFSVQQSSTPIINSLHEGWPAKDPQQFTAMMNSLRFGSFSRGNETMRGGVAAKILLRSASNYKILDRDCGSTLGITRTYRDFDYQNLVGRYIIESKKPVLIVDEEHAKTYIGKPIVVRSPMYCRESGEALCKICAGQKLSLLPNGLTIPLTDMSNVILTISLKAMHGKVLSTAELNLSEVLS